jgi:hypothetical protein
MKPEHIIITEILGYYGKNKRHAELVDTLKKYQRIQKHYETAQWINRDRIKEYYLPYPLISYQEYTELKAEIGSNREFIRSLHEKNRYLKQEIKRVCREYSLQNNK